MVLARIDGEQEEAVTAIGALPASIQSHPGSDGSDVEGVDVELLPLNYINRGLASVGRGDGVRTLIAFDVERDRCQSATCGCPRWMLILCKSRKSQDHHDQKALEHNAPLYGRLR